MKKNFIILFVFALFGCQEKETAPPPPAPESGASFSDELQVTTNRSVTLLPEAREQVREWLAYVTAQNEIASLQGRTGSQIIASSNSLTQIMEALKSSLPDTLQSPAVEARTNVLLTKARILHQLANKKTKNPDEIFEVANELIVEFNNFKLQLNELFLRSPENFEMELDEEFEESLEPDSTGTIPLFREKDRI